MLSKLTDAPLKSPLLTLYLCTGEEGLLLFLSIRTPTLPGKGPTLITSFDLNHPFKRPITNYCHTEG